MAWSRTRPIRLQDRILLITFVLRSTDGSITPMSPWLSSCSIIYSSILLPLKTNREARNIYFSPQQFKFLLNSWDTKTLNRQVTVHNKANYKVSSALAVVSRNVASKVIRVEMMLCRWRRRLLWSWPSPRIRIMPDISVDRTGIAGPCHAVTYTTPAFFTFNLIRPN